MRTFLPILFLILSFISGCKGQKEMIFSSQDVVSEEDNAGKADSKKEFLALETIVGANKWKHILQTNSIKVFQVDSILVNSAKGEYGRKVIELKSIKSQNIQVFLENVQNTKNYPINESINSEFNPLYQFEFCAANCELSMLFDDANKKIGFINLDGQEVVTISEPLWKYLKDQIE